MIVIVSNSHCIIETKLYNGCIFQITALLGFVKKMSDVLLSINFNVLRQKGGNSCRDINISLNTEVTLKLM